MYIKLLVTEMTWLWDPHHQKRGRGKWEKLTREGKKIVVDIENTYLVTELSFELC